jgi:hypothetical protein
MSKMTLGEKHQRAEHIYKLYLTRIVYPLVSDKTTYSSQLLGAGKKLLGVKFKGVFPSDKIPKLNDLAPYCILNLDKSDQSGSHWIAVVKCKYPSKDSIVYDSFGRDHKKIIPNLDISGNGRIINTDRDAEQKVLEDDCGARCLSFLLVYDNYGRNTAMLI